MTRLLKFPRTLVRRVRRGVEVFAAAAFVVEALLERFGDPGVGFLA